jgi:hypothetical protein
MHCDEVLLSSMFFLTSCTVAGPSILQRWHESVSACDINCHPLVFQEMVEIDNGFTDAVADQYWAGEPYAFTS